ncbi:MAG: hypothetical protein M3422_19430 [Actinomycetota bacterium]|nr:hypothetical protein [Actinomycetota bacterium]
MTVVEIVASASIGNGTPVERLVCHPRLPMVAALERARPAVHVWDCGTGALRELGIVGAESSTYGDTDRWQRTPAVAWHPDQPLLLISGEDGVVQWTAAGLGKPDGVPPTASYRGMTFSPDGQTLWASPSSRGGNDAWAHSDVLDLAKGTVSTGPQWDTGAVPHPAGGLVATLCSDQGATLGLFARVDSETTPAVLRVLRRALVLDADGYEAPVFSQDGRHVAIRGNAYENSLEVFAFPTLHRVLATTLGDPSPGYPYPPEWLAQMRAWSRHNIAFGARPGVLWVGTPKGTLLEVDVDDRHAVEHDVLAGSPVTALCATRAGELVVATGAGDLVLLSVLPAPGAAQAIDDEAPRAAVAAFLASTSEVPDDGDLWDHLVTTDGTRAWTPDDLATVTTATTTDPSWLRLQAAVNKQISASGQPEYPKE